MLTKQTNTAPICTRSAHLEARPTLPQQVVHRVAQAEHGGVVVLRNRTQVVLDGAPEEGGTDGFALQAGLQ